MEVNRTHEEAMALADYLSDELAPEEDIIITKDHIKHRQGSAIIVKIVIPYDGHKEL